VQVPVDYLTAADLPDIDLDDVPFEIQDGAVVLMPPPSPWHDKVADVIRHYLEPRFGQVGEDLGVAIGDVLRRPDVVGLSMDEVRGDRKDASVEMYRLRDGAYSLVRTVRLSELISEDAAGEKAA
jgi:Uma2 family endonuclease